MRGTSYIYPTTPLTNAQAAAYTAEGFEVGLHINTDCADFTPASLEATYAQQLAAWQAQVHRAFRRRSRSGTTASSGATGPAARRCSSTNGMRLDTSYYYWPPSWVGDVPGLFTGSAMPMRFARLDGTLIDVYHGGDADDRRVGADLPVHRRHAARPRARAPRATTAPTRSTRTPTPSPSDESTAVVAPRWRAACRSSPRRQMLTWLDGAQRLDVRRAGLERQRAQLHGRQGTRRERAAGHAAAALGSGVLAWPDARRQHRSPSRSSTIKGVDYAFFAADRRHLRRHLRPRQQRAPTVTSTTPAAGATGVDCRRSRHRDLQRGDDRRDDQRDDVRAARLRPMRW